jgi:ornithine cyclodeaminase
MRFLDGPVLAKVLDYAELMERIAAMFRAGGTAPLRHHHSFGVGAGTLLLMPAWDSRFAGVKIVTVVPGNVERGLASTLATYVLLDARTGEPLAVLDGRELTLRRTAATSALASRWLSLPDSARLLMIGAGSLAPYLARAHALVRPIREIAIWNRTPARAEALAAALAADPAAKKIAVRATTDLAGAVAAADIVSAATLAVEPIVRGAWLRPGQHLDLVGSFRPHMREADDETLRRASLYCDTRDAATLESGDLSGPIARGVIALGDIRGDLFDLARNGGPARRGPEEITLFKSVGHALEDLAAATLAIERA